MGMEANALVNSADEDMPVCKTLDQGSEESKYFFIARHSLSNNAVEPHMHEFFQINYVCSGEGIHVININNQEYTIARGDIFLIPPYTTHCIFPAKKTNLDIIEFVFNLGFIVNKYDRLNDMESFLNFAYVEPFLIEGNKTKPIMNLYGKAQVEVENILNNCLREFNEKISGYELMIKSYLLEILVIIGREFRNSLGSGNPGAAANCHKNTILTALMYIKEHYNENLSIEEIAGMFSFSKSYFSYLFKRITYKTFSEYLIGLRLSMAKEMLIKTDASVALICEKVGFNNISHFSRIFKHNIGFSPLGYRKMQSRS